MNVLVDLRNLIAHSPPVESSPGWTRRGLCSRSPSSSTISGPEAAVASCSRRRYMVLCTRCDQQIVRPGARGCSIDVSARMVPYRHGRVSHRRYRDGSAGPGKHGGPSISGARRAPRRARGGGSHPPAPPDVPPERCPAWLGRGRQPRRLGGDRRGRSRGVPRGAARLPRAHALRAAPWPRPGAGGRCGAQRPGRLGWRARLGTAAALAGSARLASSAAMTERTVLARHHTVARGGRVRAIPAGCLQVPHGRLGGGRPTSGRSPGGMP